MKKIVCIALALLMLFAVVSCGGSEPNAGTYEGVHAKFVGDTEWVDEVFSLELKSGGKGTFKRDDMEFDVKWSVNGEEFQMTETFLGMSNEYTGTLKDGTLDIFNGDPTDDFTYEYVFTKK